MCLKIARSIVERPSNIVERVALRRGGPHRLFDLIDRPIDRARRAAAARNIARLDLTIE